LKYRFLPDSAALRSVQARHFWYDTVSGILNGLDAAPFVSLVHKQCANICALIRTADD
jgi:hypothetical protein